MTGNLQKVPFEEALDLTGFGKFNYGMTAVCSLMIIAMVFESLSVSYLVPASACELGSSAVHQGLMAGVPLIGIIATSHVWGYLADLRGRRRVLRLSLTLGLVAGALSSLAPNWIAFSVFKLVSAAAVSGTYALSFTLLAETTPRDKRNMMMLSTTSIYLISTGLMAVLAIPVLPLQFSYYVPYLNIHLNSWRLLTLLYSAPCALAALSLCFTRESPKYLLSAGRDEKALATLRAIFASNTGKNPDDYPVKSVVLNEVGANSDGKGLWASVKAQTLPLVRPPLLRNTLLLSLEFALIYFCINPYIVWLPVIADGLMSALAQGDGDVGLCQMLAAARAPADELAADEPDCTPNKFAMLVVLGNSALLSLLNLLVSAAVDRVGRRRLLITVQVVTGAAGLGAGAARAPLPAALLFSAYLANCLSFGVLTTYSVNLFPTYLKAMAVCLTLMVGRASAFFGINILKQMLVTHCELSFYLFGSLTLAGGILGFFLPPDDATYATTGETDTTTDKEIDKNTPVDKCIDTAEDTARTKAMERNTSKKITNDQQVDESSHSTVVKITDKFTVTRIQDTPKDKVVHKLKSRSGEAHK